MDDAFVTVARFRDPAMAELVKSKLRAEGIECGLGDEDTIKINWLWSDALGGVKVRVRADQAQRARELLDQDLSQAALAEEESPLGVKRAPESWADTGPEVDEEAWARLRFWTLWAAMAAVAVWMALR